MGACPLPLPQVTSNVPLRPSQLGAWEGGWAAGSSESVVQGFGALLKGF